MNFLFAMLGIIAMFLIVLVLSEMAAAEDNARVYGHVYDSETQEPIEGADVSLYNQDTKEGRSTYSDPDGSYELWTSEGNINFVVTKDGYKDYATEFYLNNGEERKEDVYLEKKPEKNSKVYGNVYDDETQEPLEGADVSLYNEDTEEGEWNQTGSDGYYELWTSEGNIWFDVSMDGYKSFYDEFYINDKEEKNIDVYLEKKPEETAKIYGNVYEKAGRGDGDPVQEARVEVYNQDTEEWNQTSTNDEGDYEIRVAEGTIEFSVHKDGYYGYDDEFYINDKEEKQVDVPLEKKPEETAKIYGNVYEKAGRGDGDPIQDAWVEIYNQDTDEWNSTGTDGEGYYEIRTAEGNIDFHVSKDGYYGYDDNFYINDKEEKKLDVPLEKKPEETARIYGYVYEKAGRADTPIENARVDIYNQDADEWNQTWTNRDGYYELMTAEGTIEYSVDKDNYYRYEDEFYISDKEEKNVTVHLEKKPPKNSKVYGNVYDDDTQEPMEGANVYLENKDTEDGEFTQTDKEGYYEIMTAEGLIGLNVWADDYKHHYEEFDLEKDEEKMVDVYLKPKPPENSLIYGYVYEKDSRGGEPIEGANVNVYNQDADTWNGTRTDPDGYFSIRTSEGYIEFNVYHDDYKSHSEEFDIAADEEKEVIVHLEPKPPENSWIEGYVYEKGDSRNGEPLADVEIGVYNQDAETFNNTWSDDEGYYEVDVASGTLHIMVQNEEGYERYQESFFIDEDEDRMWDIYLIPQNTRLTGYVYDQDSRGGDPIEDAWIEVHNRDTHSNNGTETDENGFYEIWVAEGELEIDVFFDGYFAFRDKFYAEANQEYQLDDVYLEEKPPENAVVKGHVYDNETGEKLKDVEVQFYNEEHDYGNQTRTSNPGTRGSDIAYEINLYAGTWEVTVEVWGDMGELLYQEYWTEISVDEYDTLTLDIRLDPLPPPDSIIKGYVKAENETGLKMMVMAQSFTEFGEIQNFTESEDNGYYEIDIYGGVPMVMAAFDQSEEYGNFFKFLVIEKEDSETWYNITLYPIREDKATVKGFVTNAAGDPLEGAMVHLAGSYIGMMMGGGDDNGGGRGDDGGPRWPYMAITDDTGYYEFQAPTSARDRADDETFYLVAEYNESHGEVKKVTLEEGDNEFDFTLQEPTAENVIHIYLYPKDYDGKEDWNNGYVQFKQPFSMDSSWQTTRMFIDFIMGDNDGEVEENEEDRFMAFLEFMSKGQNGGDGPGEMTDTEDDFYVDDIYYDFESGFSFGDTLANVLGPVDDNAIITQDLDTNVTAHEDIAENTVHTIHFNVTYPDDPDEETETFIIHLPDGFAFFMAKHTENISVGEVDGDPGVIEIAFTGTAYGDELWEMVEITVASEMMGYIERIDDPGNDHITEGVSTSFMAHYINPEGLTVTTTLWDFGEGQCCDNVMKPSYSWKDDGKFDIMFIVEANSQQFVLDTMEFTVDNALPEVEAGDDIDDAVAGEELSLAGSFTDKGMADTHTIHWELVTVRSDGEAVFTDNESLTTDVMFTMAGTYTLMLTVTDDDGGMGSDTLKVTVTNTDPKPQFDNADEGDIFFGIMDIILSDEDGMKDVTYAELAYTEKDKDTWTTISADDKPGDGFTISWDTTKLPDGDYTLRVTMEDASKATGTAEIDIEINNSLPPKLVVTADIAEDKSVLTWTLASGDPVPIIPKFVKYNIYRKQGEDASFTDVSGMTPFATLDISATEYQIVDVAYGKTYYYAVTVEDRDGNENKNVTAIKYEAFKLKLDEIRITFSESKPEVNEPLRISVTVENTGGDYARDMKVEIYVDGNLEATIDGFFIAPMDKATKTGEWTTEAGEHTIRVVVTYDGDKTHEKSATITVKEDDSDTPGFELAGAIVGLAGVALMVSFMDARRRRR